MGLLWYWPLWQRKLRGSYWLLLALKTEPLQPKRAEEASTARTSDEGRKAMNKDLLPLRDGKESLPEPIDIELEKRPASHRRKVVISDADLDETLRESFPASDAPSSGIID